MPVVIGCLMPHPPIIIPDIGRDNIDRVSSTVRAMDVVCAAIAKANPETLVVISPHSAGFADSIAVKATRILAGSFKDFGAPNIRLIANLDEELLAALFVEADRYGVSLTKIGNDHIKLFQSEELDHGVLVPLYFIQRYIDVPVVSLAVSYAGADEHYTLGVAIEKAANRAGRRVAVIASGDLSHRLTPGAPAGFNPRGIDFDAKIDGIIDTGDFNELFELDPMLVEDAGECGLRSIYALAGCFNGLQVHTNIHSYEGPFGVGYLVASVLPGQPDPEREFMVLDFGEELSEPVRLAKLSLEEYIRVGQVVEPPDNTLQELLDRRAGAFVCIKIDGELRGCIGTIQPAEENIAREIMANVVQAAHADPRFTPVSEAELPFLQYSVDILDAPEKIDSTSHLDPKLYGVIVRKGAKTGLLLPNIEGVDTAEHQLAIAKQKAGIPAHDETALYRFKVTRYE
ncbi:MAG: AmmeMemoRadiSam system protein A [Candidatus Aquicultor sp.]|nr:AmmeMemoRadiSam system protein A [Candidatus Aquicultor sp.]